MNKFRMFRINFLLIILAVLIFSIVGFVFYTQKSLIQTIVITALLLVVFYVYYSIIQYLYFKSNYINIMLNERNRKNLESLFRKAQETNSADLTDVNKFISTILKLESSISITTSVVFSVRAHRGPMIWLFQAIIHDGSKKKNGLLLVQIQEGFQSFSEKLQYLIIYKNDPQIIFEYQQHEVPYLHLKAKSGGRQVLSTRQNIVDQLDSIL